MFMFTSLLCLVFLLWMLARIWKDSALLAIVCFFFWPALIFALVKYWGDKEHDIKLPFVLFTLCSLYTWYDMFRIARSLQEDPEALPWTMRMLA
jgi:hypothetical protein